MAKSNKISAVFTVDEKKALLSKINDVKAQMPFLISLKMEERKKLRKMGPKSVAYVQQCVAGCKAFPDEMKKNFDGAELEKDFDLISNLLDIQVACQALLELLNDTMMAGGIDAMEASDEVYDSLKSSGKKDANVKEMVKLIGERFKGQGKKIVPKPMPTTPAI
jgi:hypothetical protein